MVAETRMPRIVHPRAFFEPIISGPCARPLWAGGKGVRQLESFEANRVAVRGHAKQVRDALRGLGKRCSLKWVYLQCAPSPDINRLDYYGSFRRWFKAIWMANRAGAEFLFEDFRAFVESLRREAAGEAGGDWYQCLADAEREHSEAIQAALLNHDDESIRKELTEAVAAMRRQLAMLDERTRAARAA